MLLARLDPLGLLGPRGLQDLMGRPGPQGRLDLLGMSGLPGLLDRLGPPDLLGRPDLLGPLGRRVFRGRQVTPVPKGARARRAPLVRTAP